MAKWWLTTWSTYGTWLPGDPRGFQTHRHREHVPPPKRYANPGEETYRAENYREVYEFSRNRMTHDVVQFNLEQQEVAFDALVEEINNSPTLEPAILSLGDWHAHFLCQFPTDPIRQKVGQLKSEATRALRRDGFTGKRAWSKGCHMYSKNSPRSFIAAFDYILRHLSEGCLVYSWFTPHNDGQAVGLD